MSDNSDNVVVYRIKHSKYPDNNEFRPSMKYPEYFWDISTDEANDVFDGVREAFHLMGYDKGNYGKKDWNPLKKIVHAGDKVLIKPNLVMDHNPCGDENCLYTQPSVIAAVLYYVILALHGNGKVVIADAPMQECNFDILIHKCGLDKIVEWCKNRAPDIEISLKDLRGIHSHVKDGVHYYLENPEARSIIVKLNQDSEFSEIPPKYLDAMRITNYDPALLKKHHNVLCHEYAISADVLEADVIINMPKPKAHRKAGVTASLKNIVGICSRKECLPHHTNGAYVDGKAEACSDEYEKPSKLRRYEDYLADKKNFWAQSGGNPRLAWIYQQLIRVNHLTAKIFGGSTKYSEGSWYGNHTISKTICDLNKILFYADKNGNLSDFTCRPVRRYLAIADMVILGEREGPLYPTPKSAGLIAVGENPVVLDEIIMTLFGAKMEYMHTIRQARSTAVKRFPLVRQNQKGHIISNVSEWNGRCWQEIPEDSKLMVRPSAGWTKAFYTSDSR